MKKVASLASGLVLLLGVAAPVQAATYYVAQQEAKASDDNPGTEASPWKTITRCLKELKAGDTVAVRKGVYREELILPRKDWNWKGTVRPAFRSGADYAHMITFLAQPGDEVVIQGSDVVTGWKQGQVSVRASGGMPGEGRLLPPTPGKFYYREDWSVNTQQVFCDGVLLKQIAGTMPKMLMDVWKGRKGEGLNDMEPGSFFYDLKEKKLYVWLPDGSDPAKHVMEVSVREFLFSLDADFVRVSGFRMRHATISSTVNWASVGINGANNLLENCEITWTDFVGLSIGGRNNTILNCRMNHHGNSGIGSGGSGHRFIRCETSYCNYRHFDPGWHAGGVKIIPYSTDILMTGHLASYNEGDGIWFDWGNFNVTIENCTSHHNRGAGIFYEVSERGTIRNNVCYENESRGVYLSNSSDCQVLQNVFYHNGMSGVACVGVDRAGPPFGAERTHRLPAANNVIWGNVFVDNCHPDLCPKKADGRSEGWDTRPELILPEDWEGNTGNVADYNLFYRSPGRVQSFWKGWHVTNFKDLAEWQAKTGNDRHSIIAKPLFADEAKRDFRPAKGSPAIGLVFPRMGAIRDMDGNFRPLKEDPKLEVRFTAGPFEPEPEPERK